MSKLLIGVLGFLFFSSCTHLNKSAYVASEEADLTNNEVHPGKKLMETNCYVCHSPTATQSDRIAPPMIAIKKHYINTNTSKEEFEAALQEWIKNPNEKDAKMFGAVRRFGVMTKTPYSEETIAEIADYLFYNDIEQPEWFEEHFRQRQGKGKN